MSTTSTVSSGNQNLLNSFLERSSLFTQAIRDTSFGRTEKLLKEYTKADLDNRSVAANEDIRLASKQELNRFERLTGNRTGNELGTSPAYAPGGFKASQIGVPIRA